MGSFDLELWKKRKKELGLTYEQIVDAFDYNIYNCFNYF